MSREWWCHPTIQASHPLPPSFPFGSQSFLASGSFPMSQLFASDGQNIGVSASTSVLPMNSQDWFPLGWTDWISLQSKGLKSLLLHHSSFFFFPPHRFNGFNKFTPSVPICSTQYSFETPDRPSSGQESRSDLQSLKVQVLWAFCVAVALVRNWYLPIFGEL